MKIALFMYNFIPNMGGAQVFAYNLINLLADNNHSIHLYLPYKLYLQFTKVQNVNNYKVIPILRNEYFTAKYWPGLIRMRLKLAQKIQQYDVWQVIGTYPAGWVAKDLAKIVPVILRSHGDDIQKDAIMKKIPMKKFGEPSDVADLALFLSSKCSSYITGQTFHINGGMLMV